MSADANGPDLPFASWLSAAVQLHQTGHSSIVQHFRRVKSAKRDEAAVGGKLCNVYFKLEVLQRTTSRTKSLRDTGRAVAVSEEAIVADAVLASW